MRLVLSAFRQATSGRKHKFCNVLVMTTVYSVSAKNLIFIFNRSSLCFEWQLLRGWHLFKALGLIFEIVEIAHNKFFYKILN